MYTDHHAVYTFYLSNFTQLELFHRFSKNSQTSSFINSAHLETNFFKRTGTDETDWQAHRHDKANSRSRNFAKAPKN